MTYSKISRFVNPQLFGGMKKFNYLRNVLHLMCGFVGKECSPIFAQRITRTYKAFQLHSKLWSHLTKVNNGPSARKLLLGFVVTSLCQPNFDPITNEELLRHKNDLDYIHKLTEATVVCPDCKDRLVINRRVPNVKYCQCPHAASESAYNRVREGFPWAPFVETADLIIWRQPHPKFDGLYTYKVYGYYDDISPMDFLVTQWDLEYRKKWDNLVVQLKVIDKDESSDSEIVYWQMKWPKMFSNRDYCFTRRHIIDENEKVIVIMSKTAKHQKCTEASGVVRVHDYWSTMQIKAVKGMNDEGVEFGLTYFDNPGLSLPQWLTNWAAMAGIPDFLNKVRLAARLKRNGAVGVEDALEIETKTASKDTSTSSSLPGAKSLTDPPAIVTSAKSEGDGVKPSQKTETADKENNESPANSRIRQVSNGPVLSKLPRDMKRGSLITPHPSARHFPFQYETRSLSSLFKPKVKEEEPPSVVSDTSEDAIDEEDQVVDPDFFSSASSAETSASSNPAATTSPSTPEGREILSQFFKQNFLTPSS